MNNGLNLLRMLLLGAWLGAAIFFSAAVAPNVFGVLRSFDLPNAGEIAGTIVNRTLRVINISGFFVGLLSIVLGIVLRKRIRRILLIVQIVLLSLMSIATGIGQWIIAARMSALRIGFNKPIDQIATDDPNRIAFAALHGYSVATLSVAIIAGLIAFFVVGRLEAGRYFIGNHRTT